MSLREFSKEFTCILTKTNEWTWKPEADCLGDLDRALQVCLYSVVCSACIYFIVAFRVIVECGAFRMGFSCFIILFHKFIAYKIDSKLAVNCFSFTPSMELNRWSLCGKGLSYWSIELFGGCMLLLGGS